MRDHRGKFAPGNSGNPLGRPVGSKHKLSENFLQALSDDFDAHGANAIEKCREENPAAYLRTIASLMPKDIAITSNSFDHMTDEEIEAEIEGNLNKLGYVKGVTS
jgi:hypothetical protein